MLDRRLLFLGLTLSLVLPTPCLADFSGRVVAVSDGDTITVLHDKKPVKVRLSGIDAPEKRQPFGTRAKQFTSKMVFGKTVTIVEHGLDKYGRTIGDVILPDGTNVNRELVKAGMAWWYRKYALNDEALRELEWEARLQKRGLWVDKNPVLPGISGRSCGVKSLWSVTPPRKMISRSSPVVRAIFITLPIARMSGRDSP